jgi:hypothetical protein
LIRLLGLGIASTGAPDQFAVDTLAERHLTRRLFAGMLAKIAMLPSPAG